MRMGLKYGVFLVSVVAIGVVQANDNGLLQGNYQQMKEQYREAYRTYDPHRRQYPTSDPRSTKYNQLNAEALLRAEALREKVGADLNVQHDNVRQRIKGK